MNSYSNLKEKYKKIIRNCELCESSNSKVFQKLGRSEEPGVYGNVRITICLDCGFKMLNPRFEDDFYIEYYNKMYREIAFGDIKPSTSYINEQKRRGKGVLNFVTSNDIKVGKMLDHGCASGCTMIPWINEGWQCHGIDPHRPSVQLGNELGLKIKIASGEKLPFKDNSFDLVLSLGSLEHSYDFEASMIEIRRVLKNNGYLMIRWRSDKIFGSPLEYYNHNHYRFFTPNTWRIAIKKFGFTIINYTDEKLEGWESYSYLLVKKVETVPNLKDIKKFINNKKINNANEELKKIKEIRDCYYKRSKSFIDIYKVSDGNYNKILESIEIKKLSWNFLGGDLNQVLQRSFLEAKKYTLLYQENKIN